MRDPTKIFTDSKSEKILNLKETKIGQTTLFTSGTHQMNKWKRWDQMENETILKFYYMDKNKKCSDTGMRFIILSISKYNECSPNLKRRLKYIDPKLRSFVLFIQRVK